MMRTRLRIGVVLSLFPFITPTCCMHHPRENVFDVQRDVRVFRSTMSRTEKADSFRIGLTQMAVGGTIAGAIYVRRGA